MLEKLIRRLEKSGKIRKQKAGFVQIEALLKTAFKKWRRIGWKNVCKLWLQERTPEQLKGKGSE